MRNAGATQFELELRVRHAEIDTLILDQVDPQREPNLYSLLRDRLRGRGTNRYALLTDLLPILTSAIDPNRQPPDSDQLAAAWICYFIAANLFDAIQDGDEAAGSVLHAGLIVLGIAQRILAKVKTNVTTLQDLIDAFGQVMQVSAAAQERELTGTDRWAPEQYLQHIARKSGAIIGSGAWMGARLANIVPGQLQLVRQYGLHAGIVLQLIDDLADLDDDLQRGLWTYPILLALKTGDPQQTRDLRRLLGAATAEPAVVEEVRHYLVHTGVTVAYADLLTGHRRQALACLAGFPDSPSRWALQQLLY